MLGIFKAPTAGTYYVAVSTFPNTTFNPVDGTGDVPGGNIGGYSLYVALA